MCKLRSHISQWTHIMDVTQSAHRVTFSGIRCVSLLSLLLLLQGALKGAMVLQLRTTIDVDCSEAMDWFHGGLQFQVEHHIFPILPRHNLRLVREKYIMPFAKKVCPDLV